MNQAVKFIEPICVEGVKIIAPFCAQTSNVVVKEIAKKTTRNKKIAIIAAIIMIISRIFERKGGNGPYGPRH